MPPHAPEPTRKSQSQSRIGRGERVLPFGRMRQDAWPAVNKNMPAEAQKKLVVAVNVNQNGGPWASSQATPSKPAVFIQDKSRRYRVKAFLESSCKGVCETKGYRVSGAARNKLMVIPSCQYANKVFTCSKIRVVKVYEVLAGPLA